MATNGTEVYIKLPTGRSAKYIVAQHQTIRDLCDKVAAEEGVRSNQVRLKYQGKTLETGKTIAQYGVRVETILKAEILVPQNLDIVIKFDDGGIDEVVISNLEPVSALFKEVAEKKGLPTSRLQIKIEGRNFMSSSTPLMESGIAKGSTITVTVLEESDSKRKGSSGQDAAVNQPVDEETLQNVMSSFNASGRNVEVAFSFDTTGSMYSYLTEVRQKLRDSCTRLIQDIPNIRISIIAQGDYCDSQELYAVRLLDLTSDVQALVDFAKNVPATSGGDSPECYELVLKKVQQLDWSEDSAKALVVIGDLHPQPPSYTDQHIYWRDELEILTGMGVKVYGVQAGNNNSAANFYKEIAEVSGGCYLNLRHLDVITDMFLAVCYGEAHEEMLEGFERELVEAGQMTEVKQQMFSQLKEKPDSQSKSATERPARSQRHVSEGWWDPALDRGQLMYKYQPETDKWIPATSRHSSFRPASTPRTPAASVTRSSSTRSARKKGKGRCSIM